MAETLPNTPQQFDLLREAIRRERSKPADQQDRERLKRWVVQLRRTEEAAGAEGAASDEIAAGAVEGRASPTLPGGAPGIVPMAKEVGRQAAERVGQLGRFVAQPFTSDEEEAAAAEAARQRRAEGDVQALADFQASGVQDPEAAVRAANIAGSLGVDVPLSLLPGGMARTSLPAIAGRVAAETTAGGVMTASGREVDEDQALSFVGGGLLGGVLGMGSEGWGAAKAIWLGNLRRAYQSPERKLAEESATEAGLPDVLTLGESSKQSAAIQAELQTPGVDPQRRSFFDRRQQAIEAKMDEVTTRLNPNMTLAQVHDATKDAYATAVTDLTKNAQARFRANLDPGLKAVGAALDSGNDIVGGKPFFYPAKFAEEISRQMGLAMRDPLQKTSQAQLNKAGDILTEIVFNQLQTPLKGWTLGQIQQVLKSLSKDSQATGLILKDLQDPLSFLDARQLNAALGADLADVATQQGTREGDAAASLLTARKQYAKDLEARDAFEQSATDRLLGDRLKSDPEKFVANLVNMGADDFVKTMAIVDKANPGLSRAVRGAVWGQMLAKSRAFDLNRISPANRQYAMDVPEFLGNFKSWTPAKMNAFLDTNMSAKEARELQSVLVTLGNVARGPHVAGDAAKTAGFTHRMQQFMLTATMHNKRFVSRWLAGEMSPGWLERVLFDPKKRSALLAVGDGNYKKAGFANAVNVLADAYYQDQELQERLAANAKEEKRQTIGRAMRSKN